MSAVKTDGTLWSWGWNANGQLGLNNLTDVSSPVQVGALTDWLKVACAEEATSAIKTDGTLWSWGYNVNGQLGDGTTTQRSSPVQIGALTTWSEISTSGGKFTLAIKTDGTLWAWGNGAYGKLGQNVGTYYSSPVQVGALTTWSKCCAAKNTSLAIKTDGTFWGCGQNSQGQVGDGTTTQYSVFTQVGTLTKWLNVSGAKYSTIATRTD